MSCLRLPAQREMLTAELVQGYLADIKTPLGEFTYVGDRARTDLASRAPHHPLWKILAAPH